MYGRQEAGAWWRTDASLCLGRIRNARNIRNVGGRKDPPRTPTADKFRKTHCSTVLHFRETKHGQGGSVPGAAGIGF